MNVFIDTSIYLRFFEYSKDDLEELRKIEALSKKGKITVFITQVVLDEHDRRRPGVIRKSLDEFAKGGLAGSFPMLVEAHAETKAAKALAGQFEQLRDKIRNEVLEQAKARKLVHDTVIDGIHRAAKLIPVDAKVIASAQQRSQLGNPPGSGSTIGDAANWEALLAHNFTPFDDLHLLSGDEDFSSKLEPSQLNEFLADEWKHHFPQSNLTYYRTITQFTSTQFPEIKLSADVDRLDAIEKLTNSTSFMRTHAAIAELARYADFSENEAKRMVAAANSNGQICRIVSDPDVQTFFEKLVEGREHLFAQDQLVLFKQGQQDDDDPPF